VAIKTEPLGFEVETRAPALEESLRGRYDVTRLERDHPQLVALVAWLLSLPGMTHKAIAEAAGISWESVAAIAATRRESIREFKLRQAAKLGLVLDAALGGLLEKAAGGKLSALDFKLLSDAWLQMSGEGHTLRYEGAREEDPRRAELRRMLEARPVLPMDTGSAENGQCAAPAGAGLSALPEQAAAVDGARVEILPAEVTGDSESPAFQSQTVDFQ
jgi:hypothetical protein